MNLYSEKPPDHSWKICSARSILQASVKPICFADELCAWQVWGGFISAGIDFFVQPMSVARAVPPGTCSLHTGCVCGCRVGAGTLQPPRQEGQEEQLQLSPPPRTTRKSSVKPGRPPAPVFSLGCWLGMLAPRPSRAPAGPRGCSLPSSPQYVNIPRNWT